MKLVLCRNGQEFVDQFKPVLLAHEVVYQLIMGNALANTDVPCEPECFFGAVMDESDRPVLLFGHKAPYRLLIHSLDTTTIDEAVPLLVSHVVENQIDIAGVLASDAICSVFTARDSAHPYQRAISMDIMELRALSDIPLAPGHFRQATEADLDLISRWHVEFNAEATGEKLKAVAEAMGVDTTGMTQAEYRKAAIDAVRQLSIDVGIPTKLDKIKEGKGKAQDA